MFLVQLLLFGTVKVLDGTYRVDTIPPGKTVPTKPSANIQPGAQRHFVVEKGRWMLFDMMVAFSGTYTVSGRTMRCLVTEIPSGKATKREILLFDIEASGNRLKMRGRLDQPRFVMVWTQAKVVAHPQ